MSSKSSQKSNTKSHVQASVDPRLDPYMQNLAKMTDTAVNNQDRSHLQGRAVAGRNSYDDMGIAEMSRIIQGNSARMAPGTFTNMALDAASGRLLDPATNPTLQGNVDAATRPLMEDLTRRILPGLDLGAINQNAFGGDRAGIAAGQAIGDTQTAVGDIRARMFADNYNRERQYQWDSPEKFLSGMGAELSPANMMQQLGGYERGLEGLDIQNEIATREYNNNQAFAGLPMATQLMSTLAAPYGTQTSTGESTTTQKTTPNPLTEIAKIGIGAASAASGMGWNPFGGAGGGGPVPPQLPMGPVGLSMPTQQQLQGQIYIPGMGYINPRSQPQYYY